MKKVTIQDIADALGVSRNTVSKAINNSEGLADATREKILQKAVEMGYKQFSYVNAFASVSGSAGEASRSPAHQGEIALLTTIFLNQSHFASLMLDKFRREISQLGYTLSTHRVTQENLASGTLPLTLSLERTKAILCVEMFDFAYDEMLCALELPILFVDGPVMRHGRTLNADQLFMDNTSGIVRFVYDMLERGYTRLGFIGDYEHCQSFFERYLAFRTSMVMAGTEVDERFIIKVNHMDEMVRPLMELEELPDVFLCANDFVALDAMQALSAMGIRIPGQVMFCGFDDSAESGASRPPLTTVHIHTQVMAFSAVQLLMSRIKEPSLDCRIVHTQTDLIYRDSTNRQSGEKG